MQSPRVQISKLTFSNPKCNLCIQKVLDSCISKYFHAGLILDEKYIVYEKSVSDFFSRFLFWIIISLWIEITSFNAKYN